MMAAEDPSCLGNYNFEQIAHFAKRRFVDGCNTVSLLQQAKTEQEKEEIALVCLLDVKDDEIKDLQLNCRHAEHCKITNCMGELRKLIQQQLGEKIKFDPDL